MTLVDPTTYLDTIATEAARVVEVARIGPMDARVPHMRRWRLSDVVAHLGGVHRWAAEVVQLRSMSVGRRRGRDDGDALIAWFAEGAAQLTATLGDLDLDEPCPNFSPGTATTVLFWARRQAHETAMHRWDVEAAIGQTTGFAPAFAVDGIDELFHAFTRSRGGQVLTAPVGVTATDVSATWLLTPADKEGRVDVARTDAVPDDARATIDGAAEAVLLALWHRRSLDESDVHLTGDRDIAEAFLAGPTSP